MSVRSSLNSIPAYFSKYESFDTVSLQDIGRLDFQTLTLEQLKQKISKIPYKLRFNDIVLWVNGIKEEPVNLQVSFNRVYFNEPRKMIHEVGEENNSNNNFDIDVSQIGQDEDIRKHVISLINHQPACSLLVKEDWRMAGIYGKDSFLAIGGDAFLADYIKKVGQ
jgi:hypothetical protein